MIGQKGLPATFGGVERHVEELGSRLAARGHDVTVYARPGYTEAGPAEYRGMHVRLVPTIATKHLDAVVHGAACTARSLVAPVDVVHYHALGPGLFSPVPRLLTGKRVVQTVHGRDDQRAKWGGGAQAVLRLGAWLSVRSPHATIAVSRALVGGDRCVYIPNGVGPPTPSTSTAALAGLGLRPGGYLLFVGRLVPEKCPDLLVEAFRSVEADVDLVVAGGSSFSDEFVARLEHLAGPDRRVRLVGYRYGAELAELYTHAAAFVLPSRLEGLPLTLLEALSYGLPVVVSDIAPHVEIVGAGGSPGALVFPAGDVGALGAARGAVLVDGARRRTAAAALRTEVLGHYSWDAVAEATEALYDATLRRRPLPAYAPGRPSTVTE